MLARLFTIIEGWMDRVFGPRWNPFYQLGALGFFYYWVVAVSGIYLYIFFDTGTTEAYDSIEYLTVEQWYLGGVMRSLHRYASDGMVLMMGVHIVREFAFGRYKGPRWFTWTTGLPVAGLVVIAGITGYWMVWDELSQYVAIATSELFDALGIFGESISRNFMTPSSLDDRFFTLLVFVHVIVPLLMLLVLWLHLQRVSRPMINPNRGLAIGTFLMLIALSLALPAVSHEPANLARVPGKLNLDWYYLALYPLIDLTSNGTVWLLIVAATSFLVILPWLPPRYRAVPAAVDLKNCNGCTRCMDDCPFAAIDMRPRSDGLPFDKEAVVDPALCVACGICAGACPTATPFRRRGELVAGIELGDKNMRDLRDRVHAVTERAKDRIMVFGCDHARHLNELDANVAGVVKQPCVAGIPPSFIDYVISRDLASGVLIVGCGEGGCRYRWGHEWMQQRLAGERDPKLRARVDRERLRTVWINGNDGARLNREIQEFVEDLASRPTPARTPSAVPERSEEVTRHA